MSVFFIKLTQHLILCLQQHLEEGPEALQFKGPARSAGIGNADRRKRYSSLKSLHALILLQDTCLKKPLSKKVQVASGLLNITNFTLTLTQKLCGFQLLPLIVYHIT